MVGFDNPTQKGRTAEDNVGAALGKLKESGLIEAFRKTKRLGKSDLKGVDFWVHLSGQRIPLQVKSCKKRLLAFQKRHPSVPAIIGFGPHLHCRVFHALKKELQR